MIINRPLGTVDQKEYRAWKTLWLTIPFDHAHKRIQRLRAEDGQEFGIRLDEEARTKGLGHGDVIYRNEEEEIQYAIRISEEPCLVIRAKSQEDLAPLAYIIGNRHAKLYWGEGPGELLTPYEKTLEDMLSQVPSARVSRDHRLLLAEKSLMSILPSSQEDHHHDHDHH